MLRRTITDVLVPMKIKLMNIIKLLKKDYIIRTLEKKGKALRTFRRNLPMNKEWFNSIYTFNKNSIRFLPAVHNYVFILLKRYFSMINYLLNKQRQTRKLKKLHQMSGNKSWVSTPEIKHFHDKINITVYLYNRTYSFYKKKLELQEFTWGPLVLLKTNYRKNIISTATSNPTLKQSISKNNRSIKRELPIYVGMKKITTIKTSSFYKDIIKWLKLDKYTKMMQYKSDILNVLNNKNNNIVIKLQKSLNLIYYNYLIKQFNKELIYLNLKQNFLFNGFKYNELYLAPLLRFLQTIYNKQIQLNIVTLKYYYLSSSILSQIVNTKIKSGKNRGRALFPVNRALSNLKIPILSKSMLAGESKPFTTVQNVIFTDSVFAKQDFLDKFLLSKKTRSIGWSDKNTEGLVLSNIDNKSVAGVFIKITGRLTKRYKAQRAVSRLKSQGTLKNVYSAHRNLSSSVSRGYSNINVEKAMISSKIRIGAFGLTGWVSSY